jgi:hypothetical protein
MHAFPDIHGLPRDRPLLLLDVAVRRVPDVVCGGIGSRDNNRVLDDPCWRAGEAGGWLEDHDFLLDACG